MSELVQLTEQIFQHIQTLEKRVHDLTILVMKDKVDTTWVSEKISASMLGYSSARSMRLLVKSGKADIGTRNTNGRNWQYNRKDLIRYKQQTSTMIS